VWNQIDGQEEHKGTDEYNMLGLHNTVDKLARANGVRWHGHVLRKDETIMY